VESDREEWFRQWFRRVASCKMRRWVQAKQLK
jgi:hypothetical protein